ncbi:hypothetical protein, partial [Klebsiella quasipneumoniae]|uniref:hypothetical protein n=1 Tax=Klebsiella quasipneumoniae TaxID=1463165 RepID=UPI0030042283
YHRFYIPCSEALLHGVKVQPVQYQEKDPRRNPFAEGVTPHYTKGFELIKRGKAALFVLSHRAFSASEWPIGAPNCKPQ